MIGWCTFSMVGSAISSVYKFGCISNIVLGASSVVTISLSPPQKFYTIVSLCDETGTNAQFINLASSLTTTTPTSFQVQAAGVNPLVATLPAWVGIAVYGFLKS